MSRKVHGKGRSQGLSPEEMMEIGDGLGPVGLVSPDQRAAATKKRSIAGLPAPRRPAKEPT